MRIGPDDITDSLRDQLKLLIEEAVRKALAEQTAPQPDDDGRLVHSEPELAAKLGIEQHVLREQRRLGRIKFCKGAGRRIWYRPEHVEAYLKSCEKNGEEA